MTACYAIRIDLLIDKLILIPRDNISHVPQRQARGVFCRYRLVGDDMRKLTLAP